MITGDLWSWNDKYEYEKLPFKEGEQKGRKKGVCPDGITAHAPALAASVVISY